jgi:hypothetical protein
MSGTPESASPAPDIKLHLTANGTPIKTDQPLLDHRSPSGYTITLTTTLPGDTHPLADGQLIQLPISETIHLDSPDITSVGHALSIALASSLLTLADLPPHQALIYFRSHQ